ncbi:YdbH family protein [Ursidibacter sp. B-7004-1]
MIRRTLLILATLFAILLASGVALISGGRLAHTINWVLPTDWKVEIPQGFHTDWRGTSLDHFSLSYQQCPILTTNGFKLQWAEQQHIQFEKAIIDYHCLSLLPKEENSTSSKFSLSELLPLLPNGTANIQQLIWKNLPTDLPHRANALLLQPTSVKVAKVEQQLTASIHNQAVRLSAQFAKGELTGDLHYSPSDEEQHQLNFSTQLQDLTQLPSVLSIHYRWKLPDDVITDKAFQQGFSQLEWQKESSHLLGSFKLQSTNFPENKLAFPFRIENGSLSIEQGRFDWVMSEDFPLRGFLTTRISPNELNIENLFPIKTAIRISLLSENAKGKGNVVISSPEGELQKTSLKLPLQITGNVKQGNFILYSAVPMELNGEYQDLTLRFLPSALLRLTGTERFLTIHDLRFPLAGLQLNKYGLTGRLQAIFRGESPDFKNIELHLDGFARNFKMGALQVFQDPNEIDAVVDRWQWKLWGTSQLNAFKTPLNIAGRGSWHQNLVELSEFNSTLGKIQQNGVLIPYLTLNLTEPIQFAYEQFHLNGGVKLIAPKAQFSYGGELEKLSATLNVEGEVENLRLKGEVSAGKLGPIRLFARRQLTEKSSELIGRLYWSEQPANVFQPLLPFRSNWVITNGTIRGETAFSATADKGLIAGGHFAIRNGAVSLPDGELKGIEFSLPYQYQHNQVNIGAKRALDVSIAEINVGIPLTNAKMKVQGHYPYTKKRPLFLRELSFNLLGGNLHIERFALPQTQIAYVKLTGIDFAEILSLAQYHQLDLQGRANAILPFWLSGKPCYICDGSFTQASPSHLKFSPELLEAMKQSGYTEQILTYLVNDSHIDELEAKINLSTEGNMHLKTALKMHLAEHQKAKINLNYQHQENLFDLWKLINYGSQVEQNIEHSIYQQLDKR